MDTIVSTEWRRARRIWPRLVVISLIAALALTLATVPRASAANSWVPLFGDDFESGSGAWDVYPGGPNPGDWTISKDGSGNHFLESFGHAWAVPTGGIGQGWTDYSFGSDVKIVEGSVHINVRVNDAGRYFIQLHEGGVVLNKQFWPDTFLPDLASAKFAVTPGDWHRVEANVTGARIQVFVDGSLRIDLEDADKPLFIGSIAFESLPWGPKGEPPVGSIIQVDNVMVTGAPPGTRGMGFYRNHEDVVRTAVKLNGEPKETADFIMELLWKHSTVKGKQQVLILDRAATVLGLNIRVFHIAASSLKEFGLPPDGTVDDIRQKAKALMESVDWKGRDYKTEPLTSSEKGDLTDLAELIDTINNSGTGVPLPAEYGP